MVTGRRPFYPFSFGDYLESEILFSDRLQVIISANTGAGFSYCLNNKELELAAVCCARLVADIALSSKGRFALAYEKIIRHRQMQLNGGQKSWLFDVNSTCVSLNMLQSLAPALPISRVN